MILSKKYREEQNMVIRSKNDYGISCILSFISASVFFFRNEEKLVALLVYSSFMRITTSILPKISVFTSICTQIIEIERK